MGNGISTSGDRGTCLCRFSVIQVSGYLCMVALRMAEVTCGSSGHVAVMWKLLKSYQSHMDVKCPLVNQSWYIITANLVAIESDKTQQSMLLPDSRAVVGDWQLAGKNWPTSSNNRPTHCFFFLSFFFFYNGPQVVNCTFLK